MYFLKLPHTSEAVGNPLLFSMPFVNLFLWPSPLVCKDVDYIIYILATAHPSIILPHSSKNSEFT